MKTIRFILSFFLASQSVFASDFDSEVSKIKEQSTRIRLRLKGLGISSPEDSDPSSSSDENQKKSSELFTLHGDVKNRLAEQGRFVFARLLNRLVVSGEVHPVVVQVDADQDIFSGLKLKGVAHQGSHLERVQIELSRLVLRSGKAVPINAQALDGEGAMGLKADVFSSKVWAETGALAGSFVSGLASAYQTQQSNGLGFSTTAPTGRNALLQGVAQTAADGSKRLLEEATKEKPVLVVEPGTPVTIIFNEELKL